jgi:hypothetical protein
VQSATKQAVDNVGAIASIMDEIDRFTAAIADAVSQQNAAASEISRSIGHAAAGTESVARSIAGTATATENTNRSGRPRAGDRARPVGPGRRSRASVGSLPVERGGVTSVVSRMAVLAMRQFGIIRRTTVRAFRLKNIATTGQPFEIMAIV